MRTVEIKASEIKKLLKMDEAYPTEETMLKIFVDTSVTVTYPVNPKNRNKTS